MRLRARSKGPPMTATQTPSDAVAPPRVMIVVRSAPLRAAIRQCLVAMQPGCEYVEAAGGAEALGIARSRPLDLVLLDLQLPGLDPAVTVAGLLELCPACRIHLLTEPSDCTVVDAGLVGAHGCLSKDRLYDDLATLLRLLVQPAAAR
jgi:DNA-binding NarL/FixJ family response regulator